MKLSHAYYNTRVAHRPITALRRILTNVKDKDDPKDRKGVVYKITLCDYQATYIAETGRNQNARVKEHKRATKNGGLTNNIVNTIQKQNTVSTRTP